MIKKLWKVFNAAIVIFYAFFLLWLTSTFFFNYGGNWMKEVAKKIPLKEKDFGTINTQQPK
jgi:hypothetical protein